MRRNWIGTGAHRAGSESRRFYALERAYLAAMLAVTGRLLVAASHSDREVQRELSSFPEGTVIGFSILGDSLRIRLRVQAGRLVLAPKTVQADLDIIFKHMHHAFMVLSFQESTPVAFARQRLVTQGDPALSMRFTRCLNRVQAVSLPRFVAARALKALPPLSLREKLVLAVRLYAGLLTQRS